MHPLKDTIGAKLKKTDHVTLTTPILQMVCAPKARLI